MEWIYFWILTVTLAITLAVTFFKPERIYEYPYFMASSLAVFIIPQSISLIRFPGGTQPEWIANALLMACLCFGACLLGYRMPPVNVWTEQLARPVNLDKLFHGGLVFIAISYCFNFLIAQMSDDAKGNDMWTGKVTIYSFFAGLIYPAFAICLGTALRTQGMIAWAATVLAAIPPLEAAIFYGRRESAAHFLMTCGLTLYFELGFKPPRLIVIAAILGAMLVIPITGQFRSLAAYGEWHEVKNLDLLDNFNDFVNQENPVLELRNAAYIIEAAKTDGYYWGESYWDILVFRFVPAQLLGRSFKEGIMFRPSEDKFAGVDKLGYSFPGGTTPTGIGDSFQEFGWFGCIFFAFFGRFFKTLWTHAIEKNNIMARIFYIQLVITAMLTITHGTVVSLPDILYYAIFLGLIYLYARVPMSSTGRPRGNRKTRVVSSVQADAPHSAMSPGAAGKRGT